MMAFHVNTNEVYHGAVHVGGWDIHGIAGNSNCDNDPSTCVHPSVMKTTSATSWDLTLDTISQGSDFITLTESTVLIEPSERLITMNQADFEAFNA